MERKNYIDNIRWMTVLIVILYHVIYIFNSVGVISNFDVQGIAELDAFLSFVYPWFMALLFVVAGISARYSLQKRSSKEFAIDRVKRMLIPSIAGMFLYGWILGLITNHYTDMFAGNGDAIPGILKYFIFCMCGIGPLWFARELFLASMVLLLVRKIDKNDKLSELGQKANLPVLLLMVIPFWGSSIILNMPLIEVYRHGFYIFSFLLGYYIFSHEEVIEHIRKIKLPLLILACVCGVAYTIYYFGENYTTKEVLRNFFTNGYAWLMILAILACAKDWLNFTNPFSQYMTKANFGFYVLHYPVLAVIAFIGQLYLDVPMIWHYVINLVLVAILLPVVYEILRRIPVLRFLVLGVTKKQK
ncbi:MAG: acyltransferase [Lachnospiraceae bacterium]|nr:acyltransferase [Lachnospiraceae bacterium]